MKSNKCYRICIIVLSLFLIISCRNKGGGNKNISDIKLPVRGLCAHRGAMATYPENTLIAFREAVKAGAQMIEFDVSLSKDQKMVILHDATVDRTTNGTGRVSDLTLNEIKKLDAGSWKSPEFVGQKIPTLEEVLEIMPLNIWLNIHLKEDLVSVMVAETLAEQKRLHQAFLACGASAADKARKAVPGIMICNMDRQDSSLDYVKETINKKADFIQLTQPITPSFADYAKMLKDNGIRINYFGTDSPDEIRKLFEYGIDFPLVNDIIKSIKVASELGIQPVIPVFVGKTNPINHP
jgi:glycerophosphoryl diester phosphodiesterase